MIRSARALASPRLFASIAILATIASIGACASAGRWGYARQYVAASGEHDAIDSAVDLDAPMAAAQPEKWIGKRVRFFMVVDERTTGPGGNAYLTGKIHPLNEINGCANKHDETTCRVTIKPTGHDTVHVAIKLAGDDDLGPLKVAHGTLVRIVGVLGDKTDADDGKLVVQGSWLRAWPLGYYANEGDLIQ